MSFIIVTLSFSIEQHFKGFSIVLNDDTRVHIGDVYMTNFTPSEPDGLEFTWRFNIIDDPIQSIGYITAKHIDPIVESGPILMKVNKKPFCFLNYFVDYIPEIEMFATFSEYKFTIPASFLKKGENTFTLQSIKTEKKGFDDINVKKLVIKIRISK